jgi:phospholipid/cholesterol/gamma-HCH transport system substrate-binding protein
MNINETLPITEVSGRQDASKQVSQRFKFQRVNEITGAFVLIVIALLVATVIWTGRSQRWFKSNVTLRIVLPEAGAAGIRQGSEVYFLGTRVGSVSDVIVDLRTGRMEAEANIRSDFFRFVRADSSAIVKKKFGVAGDSFFEIARGMGAPLPERNASIVCSNQFQSALESAIEEIRSETMVVLKKTAGGLDTWTQLGADLRETRQHLDQLTARLEKITASVEQGEGTVGKLLTDSSLADEATNLLARAYQTMSDLQGVVTNLNAAVKNVQTGTERLPEITDAAANEAKELPGLVRQTQTSMRELERLIEGMQRHWLVRKYVNRTNPPPLRPTGVELQKESATRLRSPKNSTR